MKIIKNIKVEVIAHLDTKNVDPKIDNVHRELKILNKYNNKNNNNNNNNNNMHYMNSNKKNSNNIIISHLK